MEIEQFIIEQEIRASSSQFLQNLKIGDHVIVYMTNNIFREAIIESDLNLTQHRPGQPT